MDNVEIETQDTMAPGSKQYWHHLMEFDWLVRKSYIHSGRAAAELHDRLQKELDTRRQKSNKKYGKYFQNYTNAIVKKRV